MFFSLIQINFYHMELKKLYDYKIIYRSDVTGRYRD